MAEYRARGLYVGRPLAWLQSKLEAAQERDGIIVSASDAGGGQSLGGYIPNDEKIIELQFAIARLTGTAQPTRTRPDYGGSSDGGYGYGCDPSRGEIY